jgi:hypothetical protein
LETHEWAVVAYIVHQHVDPSVLIEHGTGEAIDIFKFADVDYVRPRHAACTFNVSLRLLGAVRVYLGYFDKRPMGCEES